MTLADSLSYYEVNEPRGEYVLIIAGRSREEMKKEEQAGWEALSLEAVSYTHLEDGVEIHEPDSLEDYSGQFKLRIPRSLHRSLAEHSQREGISMNQYCVYLLSKNDAVFSK